MLLLRAPTRTAYAKVDAEEARQLRAQYLIQKVLEEKSPAARSRPPALVRVKARIGVRLKKLRLAIRSVRVRACRTLQRHLRNLRKLIALGGQQGSGGGFLMMPRFLKERKSHVFFCFFFVFLCGSKQWLITSELLLRGLGSQSVSV